MTIFSDNRTTFPVAATQPASPMTIVIVTDAWEPQVNGVVRTLKAVTSALNDMGHRVEIVSPDQYPSLPCPSYPEIRLAMTTRRAVGRRIEAINPDAVHIATEGPLGYAARRHCLINGYAFTTAYHTQFPDYIARRTGLSAELFWPFIRRFHGPSSAILTSTESIRQQLVGNGLANLAHWGRGVDLGCFSPDAPLPDELRDLPRPIMLNVGRVAVEKNIEAFLKIDMPGSKVVVGDGPALAALRRKYPQSHFLGPKAGAELAGCYAAADVFVFPSRTDTFGLVMIEALACGTPVAAYPVHGPLDVLTPASGAMREELGEAIGAALALGRADCIAHGQSFTWEASAWQFLDALVPVHSQSALAA